MIKIRFYNNNDFEKVKSLCEKHNLRFPYDNQMLIIAENDEKEIVGIAGIRVDYVINPLISDNNPLVANNLGRIIEGIIIGQGITRIKAEVNKENEKHINQLEKDGYILIEKNSVILQKTIE